MEKGEPLCLVYAEQREKLDAATPLIEEAFEIGDQPRTPASRILEGIDAG